MTKPRVNCQLVLIETPTGHAPDVFVAKVQRCSHHPVLGADRKGSPTVTSRIVRIDFDHKIIETLNTYYYYGE